MACSPVVRFHFYEGRFDTRTYLDRYGASWVEWAASRWICRTRDITFQNYSFSSNLWVRYGDSLEKALVVGVHLSLEEPVLRSHFFNLTEIHHSYALAHVVALPI